MPQKPSRLSHVKQPISEEILLCSNFELDGETLSELTVVDQSPQFLELPLMGIPIQAGFPSPAEDFVETSLDINQFMIAHPSATYFVRVMGDSMSGASIRENDYLVVDRSVNPTHNAIVIAVVDRELTVKRLYKQNGILELKADNPAYSPIRIQGDMDLHIWGVVCGVFRKTI